MLPSLQGIDHQTFVCREQWGLPPAPAPALHAQLHLDAGDLRGEVRAHPAVHGRAPEPLGGDEAGHAGSGGELRQIRLVSWFA